MSNRKLYRDMKVAEDGLPVLGNTTTKLGVRIVGYNVESVESPYDTVKEEDGNVHPGRGMSVSPEDINDTLNSRFESRIRKGKTILWEIDESVLPRLSLKYVQDRDDHGYIEPTHPMPPERYEMMIRGTRRFWRESHDLQLK